jgi:hypothetical protein
LYNILIDFDIHMRPVRLIKMCLHETYSGVWVGQHLSDMFPIKNVLKQIMFYRHCFSKLI